MGVEKDPTSFGDGGKPSTPGGKLLSLSQAEVGTPWASGKSCPISSGQCGAGTAEKRDLEIPVQSN